MKTFALLTCLAAGAVLLLAESDFPDWGDPSSPASTHLSPHYITQTYAETHVPNLVTAVLADYRGYDTMFETAVIFCAGLAILLVLRRGGASNTSAHARPPREHSADLIIATGCRLLIPFMQVFALYVVAHGHYSPGGGFQGGVILGASLILLAMAFDIKTVLSKVRLKTVSALGGIGVLIYAGIGLIPLLLGGNFLDYSYLSAILPATDPIMARSHAMLGIEIGVAFTVTAVMLSIYLDLASKGNIDEGL